MPKTTDVIIIGAGIAGLVCALEILRKGKRVLIIDAQPRENVGGLARSAFGGMALVGTPEQCAKGIKDSPELAFADWCSFAEYNQSDEWPRAWAKRYVEYSVRDIYEYIQQNGGKFLPAVNWVERGQYGGGNSVPRYHILWGASLLFIQRLYDQLKSFEGKTLEFKFSRKVTALTHKNKDVDGCIAVDNDGQIAEYFADNLVIACGGYTGNLDLVKALWPDDWGSAPSCLLNGSHPQNDGAIQREIELAGGLLTNRENMWHYAAGIPHPKPEFEQQGISLIPCKSGIWIDHTGKRIGPEPLITGFDTYHMCRQLSRLQLPHSWQILNTRIANKELAVSGSDYNLAIRDRKVFRFAKEILFGNSQLVNQMVEQSDNFVIADNLEQLVDKMNQLTPEHLISKDKLNCTVNRYDTMLAKDSKYWNDDQVRRIQQLRGWFSERLRTCRPQPILKHTPLIAIKLNLITRKSLGGIRTDIQSRILNINNEPIRGLYAIGEAAGFGGGGASGKRSLEGTFLSGCILTARQAARDF